MPRRTPALHEPPQDKTKPGRAPCARRALGGIVGLLRAQVVDSVPPPVPLVQEGLDRPGGEQAGDERLVKDDTAFIAQFIAAFI